MRFSGVGRFARARGSSVFARAFNGELPRNFSNFAFNKQSFAKMGEIPLGGFAEQSHPLLGLLNSLRTASEGEGTELDLSEGEEGLDATLLLSTVGMELNQWSLGITIGCESEVKA